MQSRVTGFMLVCCFAFAGFALANPVVSQEQTIKADVAASGHAHVMRKQPWHTKEISSHNHAAGTAPFPDSAEYHVRKSAVLPLSPTAPQQASGQDPNHCNTSMVGTWLFSDHIMQDREFEIFRNADGVLYFRQTFANIVWGFREGVLEEHKSENAARGGCCFMTTLNDGALLHLYFHQAGRLAPETLEVSQVGLKALPAIATRAPLPAYSVDSAAWLVAGLVLVSGPLIPRLCSRFLATGVSTSLVQETVAHAQHQQHAGEDSHEDWMDVLRIFCIVLMVLRHALQSLERLGRIRSFDLSFFLHGLPLFVYVAGRAFGTSVATKGTAVCHDASLKAQFLDHLTFVKKRSLQLLLPSIIGTALVVIPTEYAGRHWRRCAAGPDAPLEWLQNYLFPSHGGLGLSCEGMGWLGFMVVLFAMQIALRPWAIAFHRRITARADAPRGVDLCWVMLWLSGCISVASFALPGDSPLGIRGFLRPDTALAFGPLLADLLTGTTAVTPASLRVPALMRRIIASVALATWTKKAPYDDLMDSQNVSCLWIELLLLMVFYQQGVADGIFRNTKGTQDSMANPVLEQCWCRLNAAWTSLAARASFTELPASVVAWGLFLILSFVPIASGIEVSRGPGYRYPAYSAGCAGNFVLRSWAVLGLGVWWFGQHLPKAFLSLKVVAPVGFTLYVLHWFFIEVALGWIYVDKSLVGPHGELPDELPWWLALFLTLGLCLLAVTLCHVGFMAVTGQGVGWKFSRDDLASKKAALM